MLRPRSLSGVVFFAVALTASLSLAQERMGDVLKSFETKKELKMDRPKASMSVKEPERKARKAGVDSGSVLVSKINVIGNVPVGTDKALLSDKKLGRILSAYEGRELTLGEIYEVSDKLTAAYREAGYLVTYAYVPPQTIKDGTLVINVVAGKLGTIEVTGNRHFKSDFIENHLARSQEGALSEKQLERGLVLLNEYSDLNVKAALKPGQQPGTTDVVVTVEDETPVHFSAFYDNYGSKYTSEDRFGVRSSFGNLITSGDSFSVAGITAINPLSISDLSYVRLDYTFPITSSGLTAGLYYANSLFENEDQFGPTMTINGRADVGGFYLAYPFIKTVDSTLEGRISFDFKDVANENILVQSNLNYPTENNIRAASLAFTYDFMDNFSGRNYARLTLSQGFEDLLGGGNYEQYPVQPYDPAFDYTKLNFDFIRLQKLPGYNTLSLSFSGQFTDQTLPSPEQITIGGAHTVRGFQLSEHYGDKGFFASLEFLFSPVFTETMVMNKKWGDTFKLALFTDYGDVKRSNPVPQEAPTEYLSSIGAGVRLYLNDLLSIKYDFAVPRIDQNYKVEKAEHLLNVTLSY
jgi:hemolysin activation/secretion protein